MNEDNDDLVLELDSIEDRTRHNDKVKNRFEQLSEKVILTSREKDEALSKATAAEEARMSAEKERDFYRDFSSNVAKYPAASEFQEQILEKVRAGYATEDAMVSVLAREGRLDGHSAPAQEQRSPASNVEGGSAPTTFEGTKSVRDMTPDEKLAELAKLDVSELESALRGR